MGTAAVTLLANFVDITVPVWGWVAVIAFIVVLLVIDLSVFHREAHVITTRSAAIETIIWVAIGVGFTFVIWVWFNGAAASEYISGYLVEESLSIDNVFVWALILSYFKVPAKFQHRVLFWGIFGALVLRAGFIFAGLALIQRFEFVLYIFGAFLIYTAFKLVVQSDEGIDPSQSRFLRWIRRIIPTSDELDGHRLFTRVNGRRMATPLLSVLVLIELTDVLFAVDSVPAVLGVSREQFIVFTSNAFAILGLRAMYFLLADLHARFSYLQQGLAMILAFIGVKMIVDQAGWTHIPTWLSLVVIAMILVLSVLMSIQKDRRADTIELIGDDGLVTTYEPLPPPQER